MALYDFSLLHPFTMIVAGPTGSGKSTWIKRLCDLSNNVSLNPPKKIIYFYGEYQPLFSTFKNVEFIHGLQERQLENLENEPTWIIIDDLMTESSNSSVISDLFTKGSHHRNVSVIFMVQNFFTKGKEMRNISLNCHYLVLFKNPRNKSLATDLARQMYPDKIKKFQSVFNDATSKPYTYLFVDLKPNTPEELRLSTNILGESPGIIVYSI